jgi:hypothetical protein
MILPKAKAFWESKTAARKTRKSEKKTLDERGNPDPPTLKITNLFFKRVGIAGAKKPLLPPTAICSSSAFLGVFV